MNRAEQPSISTPEFNINIPLQRQILENGSELFLINSGDQDVIRVDFLFEAGTWVHSQRLVPILTCDLLKEGSSNYSSFQISEKLDYYGAYLSQTCSHHHSQVSLYTLTRYINETLEVVKDILINPTFNEEEFATLCNKKRQQFQIENQRVQYIADKHFQNHLFGGNHPYGRIPTFEDYDRIKIEDIKDFYLRYYNSKNLKIFVSGKVEESTVETITKLFGESWGNADNDTQPEWTTSNVTPSREHIKKDDAVQSAIRIGKILFNKRNPDFIKLQVVNMIFGGFFGSRLMQNIREDKGYTYGINSILASLQKGGLWMITTSCANEYVEDTISEVFIEMDRLQTELIAEDELFMVKNYFLGELTRSQEGPFAMAESFRNLWEYDLPLDYYHKMAKVVRDITPEEIQNLAKKYLRKEDFSTIVCGG